MSTVNEAMGYGAALFAMDPNLAQACLEGGKLGTQFDPDAGHGEFQLVDICLLLDIQNGVLGDLWMIAKADPVAFYILLRARSLKLIDEDELEEILDTEFFSFAKISKRLEKFLPSYDAAKARSLTKFKQPRKRT